MFKYPAFLPLSLLILSTQTLALPAIQQWETTQGARVYFVPAPELPILDLKLVFDAAAARDGDKAGLAMLTNGLLEEGAGGLSAEQIAEQLADTGAQLSLDSARDMASVSLRTLTQPDLMQTAINTFTQVVSQPDFPPDALERVRKQMLQNLQYQQQSPESIVEQAFYSKLYGKHPYANPPQGTTRSVTHLSREDVQNFYQQHYVARNAVLAIVGNLDRAAAETLAEQITQPLPSGEPAAPLPPVTTPQDTSALRIAHPSKQTHIMLGQIGYSRYDPDAFPLYVANYPLGGNGLVARLFSQVREKRGLAYSVYSNFIPMRQPGPFYAALQTRNEQAEQAISLVRQTIADYVTQGLTDAELIAAKKNLTGSFPLQIDSNDKITAYVAMIGFYGLPLDYLHTWMDKINAVTLEQAKAVLQRRLQPTQMLLVTVGETPAP